jgi:replicative DNA helicase
VSPQELEAAVCGMVLREPAALGAAVAGGIEPRHFADHTHARLYEAAIEAWKKSEPIDVVSLCNRVGRDKAPVIQALRSNAPMTANVAPFIRALIDSWRSLELQAKLADISAAVSKRRTMDPLDPIIDRLAELLVVAGGSSAALVTTTIVDALDKSLQAAEQRILSSQAGKTPGATSGFPLLDDAVYGFQPGFMYVLGARTSVGKTTMAATMAVNAALAGHKVAFVTVEMSDADLADKMLTRMARVKSASFLSGELSDEEMDRIAGGARSLAPLPLFFTVVSRPTVEHLIFEIHRLVKVEKVELVIIDYLQLFELGHDGRHRNGREEAKAVSAKLKMLTQELKVPLLVLSQLNRLAPEEGQPELVHIAETDQIARDADVVLFLYREDDDYFLSVAKNRRGKRTAFKLNAELQYSLFTEDKEVSRDGRRDAPRDSRNSNSFAKTYGSRSGDRQGRE